MPHKDQTSCYRTINGERYINLCDVLSPADEEALELVKAKKLRHRTIKHPDGFAQLFVHHEDVAKVHQ